MEGRWLTPDTPSAGFIYRTLRIPNSELFLSTVSGALIDLMYKTSFEEFGDLTPQQVADYFVDMYEFFRDGKTNMIGHIHLYSNAAVPDGSLVCDGATYLRTTYPDLYAVIGAIYKIDADHFKVPDFRGRVLMGNGAGTGLTPRANNDMGGAETHALTSAENAAHVHTEITAVAAVGAALTGVPIPSAVPGVGNTGSSGSGTAHSILNPFTVIKHGIWYK